MRAIFYAAAHHRLGHPLQLPGAGLPAPLDGRLAGHGVEQLVPGGGGVGPAGGQQFLGDLGEGGLNVLHLHIEGGLADHQFSTQLVHIEAELLQQGQAGQQSLLLLRRQAAGHGGQQGLGHGVIALRLHPVEIHPLVGGVLVDEEHRLPLLHDDVSVQHLPGHPPGLLLGDRDGGGDLLRRGRLRGGGRGLSLCRRGRDRRLLHRTGSLLRHRPDHRRSRVNRGGAGRLCLLDWPFQGSGSSLRLRAGRGLGRLEHRGPGGRAVGGILDPDLSGDGEPGLVGCDGICPFPALDRLVHRPALRFLDGDLRMAPVLLQGGEDGVVHRRKHLTLVAELHFRLGGVDVHVHGIEFCLQMEDTAGEFAHHLLILVGLLQGGHHDPGLDLAAVDEEELPIPAAPAAGGEGDKAGDGHVLSGGLHRPEAQSQLPAQNGVDGALQPPVPGGEQLLLAVPDELHRHLRVGQGHPLDHREDGGPLGGVLLHEF